MYGAVTTEEDFLIKSQKFYDFLGSIAGGLNTIYKDIL